jgi:hypothetical protein
MANSCTTVPPWVDWLSLPPEKKEEIRQQVRGLVDSYLGDNSPVDSMTVEVRDETPDFRYDFEIVRLQRSKRKLSITIEHDR